MKLVGKMFSRSLASLNILMNLQALDLGRGATGASYMVEEIWQELAKARYVEWVAEASARQRQQRELK